MKQSKTCDTFNEAPSDFTLIKILSSIIVLDRHFLCTVFYLYHLKTEPKISAVLKLCSLPEEKKLKRGTFILMRRKICSNPFENFIPLSQQGLRSSNSNSIYSLLHFAAKCISIQKHMHLVYFLTKTKYKYV